MVPSLLLLLLSLFSFLVFYLIQVISLVLLHQILSFKQAYLKTEILGSLQYSGKYIFRKATDVLWLLSLNFFTLLVSHTYCSCAVPVIFSNHIIGFYAL